ncbi:MAG: type II secretion system F family protein [Methylococcaceae bacterium]|nr:type II secretion system F family protein [Methylococcaceae bacterium]
MARFHYQGREAGGAAVEGVLEGDSAIGVARLLQARGVIPVTIRETREAAAGAVPGLARQRRSRRKPDLDDLMFFCRQMYTLTKSGVPLNRGINGLAETTRNELLSTTLRQVMRDLEAGYGLSQAFHLHPAVFSPMMIGIVQVGENSGRVDEAFLLLAGYLQRERETRSRMKAAMRYPAMVVIAIVLALTVINLWVIPAFAKVFAGFKAELPWATKILLATSRFTLDYWPVILVAMAAAVWLWLRFVATERGRLWWDRHKLDLPVIGPVLVKASLARFARSFAMMMRSGVPLLQSMLLLGGAVDNAYMATLFAGMRGSIERGESISRTASGLGLFPPLVLQMMEVGEETGRMEEMLDEVAEYYDGEVDTDLGNLGSAIEPILLLVVGGMVLVLALGVFLPIWDLGKAALHH